MVKTIITQTLPTIIGIGVVSRTTEQMFARKAKMTKTVSKKSGRRKLMVKKSKTKRSTKGKTTRRKSPRNPFGLNKIKTLI